MKTIAKILTIIVLGLAAIAYYFYASEMKAQNELKALQNTNDELTVKLNNLEKEKAKIASELEVKISNISKEKEEEIAKLKVTHDELVSDMKKEIEQGQIKITQMADRLSVSMVDKILFPSGEANIMPDGLEVLERIQNTVNESPVGSGLYRNPLVRNFGSGGS